MAIAVPDRWAAVSIIAVVLGTACAISEDLNPVTGPSGAGGGTNSTTGAGGTITTTSSTTGGAGGCLTAADCPGADTECATRTCTGGLCGVDLAPLGFLAGAQTSGDCQKVTCDGNGGIAVFADDADVPSDGDPCTQDVCTSGQPSHLPAPAGTTCGPGGQLACDGAGNCVGCAADADCGTSTACAAYTCDTISGLCAVTYVPSGQGDPGGQTAGNCQKIACNGNGGTLSIADDADVPDDGNSCTDDGCSMGQPTHAPASAGTLCGNGFKCDGNGACQACLADSDCGAATPCATPACAGGACVSGYVPSGQGDPGGQTAGDCQKIVCNGSGGTLSIADDTDVPDDGDPCTADACSGGVASHTLLQPGATCGVDLVCDGAGSCVGCLADADCGTSTVCATHHCQMGACVTESTPAGTGDPGGQVAGDCQKIVCNGSGGTTTVPDDTDAQDDGNPCTQDTCSGGTVQHPPGGCGAGFVCNGASCVSGCLIGGIFFAADTVNPGNACQVCNPGASTSAWSNRANGTGCNDGNSCTWGDHCTSGVCGGTALTGAGCTTTFGTDGVCSNGSCISGCFVNGQVYPPQSYFADSQICLSCDPSVSTSSLYAGSCHYNNQFGQCSGAGVCNFFYTECATGCSDCTVKPCGSGLCYGLPVAYGTSCVDDGNPCTTDMCNGLGGCIHFASAAGTICGSGLVCHGNPSQCDPGCYIGGTFYAAGAANPANPCQVCDTTASTSDWSSKPSGTACPDDGNPCTIDACDGAGSCAHATAPDGTICGSGLVCLNGGCVAGP